MSGTRIEWADAVWNPVTGCTKVSPGCKHCYAERFARRLAGRFGYPEDEPFRVTLHHDRLREPLSWRTPRRVFVNSMSDLFHEAVPLDFIARIWDVMVRTPQHTYLILTKRPERMRQALGPRGIGFYAAEGPVPCPQPNIWLGVSAENQEYANRRIPLLLQTPAAVRFVSLEPLLGPIDLCNMQVDPWTRLNVLEGCGIDLRGPAQTIPNVTCPRLDWVIVGGETGPAARPMYPDWARSIRDQCVSAGVPFFFKQWGEWAPLQDDKAVRPGDVCISPDGFTDMAGRDYVCFANESEGTVMRRVGRKHVGRLLDGRTWDEVPDTSLVEIKQG